MDQLEAYFELQRLQVLEQTGLITSAAPPELQQICEHAKTRFQVAIAMVTLVTADCVSAKAGVGTDLQNLPRRGQFCDYTIRASDVFVVSDATKDERFNRDLATVDASFIRFYAGAPVIYFRQVRLGALCLLDPFPREFSHADRSELGQMANEVASALVIQEIDNKTVELASRHARWARR